MASAVTESNNFGMDDMSRLVAHDLDGKIADLGIAEHPSQARSVGRRSPQVSQPLMLVFVIGDDQCLALPGH